MSSACPTAKRGARFDGNLPAEPMHKRFFATADWRKRFSATVPAMPGIPKIVGVQNARSRQTRRLSRMPRSAALFT
jgi:hypothetical protein